MTDATGLGFIIMGFVMVCFMFALMLHRHDR